LSYLNTASLGANPTVGLYRYYTSTGLATWVGVSGTSAYSVTDAGVKTEIRASLTDGKRCSLKTYRDLLYVSNGFDNIWVWDGDTTNSVTWELGSCKAVLGAAGGSLEASESYYYAITFDDDAVVNGAFSNTVTTDASKKQIELTQIPLGPIGTTNRKIYRTEGDGSALKLVATLADNTTTVYSDSIADASLTTAYASVTDDMPKGAEINIHREKMFITRDPSFPSKIYYSNPYLPHYIQQTTNLDYMEISPDDGDEIMGIPIQLGVMVCVKKNSIRKVHVTSAISGADPETWYADDPIAWIGSPAPWSITQTPNGVVFLGWDHWYIFDGASAQPVFDEFDTGDILEATYNDIVGYFHNENFLAAYTDKESAAQKHNRLMVYNIKRQTLSYDLWTGSSITGPNCFGARTGDDEVGDLYFGDSAAGFILKAKDTNSSYRLRTKTECEAGTENDVFVGGTENSPSIEVGDTVSASAIPDDIIIFWDNEETTPGSSWVEITGNEDTLIKLSTTAGTSDAGTSHLHTLTGSIPSWSGTNVNYGDGNANCVSAHTHEVAANSNVATPIPRNIKYRMFKSSSNTDTEFPVGAIIMWDQATPPEGYQLVSHVGYYPMQDIEDLGVENSSTHSHSFSIPTGTAAGSVSESDGGTNGPRFGHTHTLTGALSTETLDTWEVAYADFTFIKKVGETSTWDGVNKYCYALFAESTAASNGWAEDSTYDTMFLKIGEGEPSTGSAANYEHTHTAGTFETSTGSASWGNGGYHASGYADPHTHSVVLTASSEDAEDPPSITFRLFKKVLGTMKDYNEGIGTTFTSGTWTSLSAQINADTLLKMYWNESLTGTDNVVIHTRTGATQSAVEDATAITSVAGNVFTLIDHGLVNTNRIILGGTTVPTGTVTTIMYYVLKLTDDTFSVSLTSGGSAVALSSSGTAVTFKEWEGALTDSNGSQITSSANNWLQYLLEFTCDDSTVSIPKVYFTNGYVVKYEYHGGVTTAETSVNCQYGIGFRNFDEPSLDKVFKKIITKHEGDTGSFTVSWETENSTGSFVVSLDDYPEYWDSYFQDDAMGKDIDFTISKNDLNSFRISEIKGIYSPYQVIL